MLHLLLRRAGRECEPPLADLSHLPIYNQGTASRPYTSHGHLTDRAAPLLDIVLWLFLPLVNASGDLDDGGSGPTALPGTSASCSQLP